MGKRTCIGFDIGRSAVKVVASAGGKRHELTFLSLVTPAVTISDDREAAVASKETVSVDGKNYFIGDTARIQGGPDTVIGMDDDWTNTPAHAALFLGGLKKLEEMGVPNVSTALIVVGLPAGAYGNKRGDYLGLASKLAPQAEIKVAPQSMGPFFTMMFDDEGKEQANFDADKNSWAVIEVGHFTTDFALIENGRTVEKGFGSCEGLRVAVEEFQKLWQRAHPDKAEVKFAAATAAMETKKVKFRGNDIDVKEEVALSAAGLSQIILNRANQFLGDRVNQLDGIKVAGGGAPLVIKTLQKQWSHVSLADNARHAVAEGFCRFAVGLERFRAKEA